jgi:hypothetical protein
MWVTEKRGGDFQAFIAPEAAEARACATESLTAISNRWYCAKVCFGIC